MTFDISRSSFDPKKNYLGVVMQQGRVQLDSDWNEWVAELGRRTQAGTLDAVGIAGVPRSTPEGFKINVDNTGNLTIGPGRIYVDGLLVENHGRTAPSGSLEWDSTLNEESGVTPVKFLDQPYLPFAHDGNSLIASFNQPTQLASGNYLIYLDVWQRCVTPVHDPELIEKAVGVDTTGRIQTVWQVKVHTAEKNANCSTQDEDLTGWTALTRPSGARLTTSTGSLGVSRNPCLAPPGGGYTGLENQLYRVEIHKGGSLEEATFKWSRDNGSVVTRVLEIHEAIRIVVESTGRDEEFLGFRAGDWVEVLDDWHEMHCLPGHLRRIRLVDKPTHTLILEACLPQGIFPVASSTLKERHTRIRRWDQAGKIFRVDGTEYQDLDSSAISQGISDGIMVADGRPGPTVLGLEEGIQVQLTLKGKGQFKTGDYWIFTARSSDGSIEKLHEAPPAGIHHHFARLAVVERTDLQWLSQSNPSDCRTIFPALTDITAEDVSYRPNPEAGLDIASTKTVQQALDVLAQRHNGMCTVVVGPKDDLQAVFDAIANSSEHAASVCFKRGTYDLRDSIVINGNKKLRIMLSGCGSGSHLRASREEVVMMFKDCVDVTVRDLSVEAGAKVRRKQLRGALHFADCQRVEVSRVAALCAGDGHRAASCITARHSVAPDPKHLHVPSVHISDCDLMVGYHQVGVLVINACSVLIESNRIHAAPRDEALRLETLVGRDPVYRARLKSALIANLAIGQHAPAGGITNRKLGTGKQALHFYIQPGLKDAWSKLFIENPPSPEVRNGRELLAYVSNAANQLLKHPAARNSDFRKWFELVERENVATLFQGIVVAGQVAEEVRVRGNTIEDCIQGIHVGVSHEVHHNEQATGNVDHAGTVHLIDNTIEVVLPHEAYSDERHGIFVGNAKSIVIESNRLKMRQLQRKGRIRIDGIRVHGHIGPMLLIKRNHLTNYTTGIAFTPHSYPEAKNTLWSIGENLAEYAFGNHTVVTSSKFQVDMSFNRPPHSQGHV